MELLRLKARLDAQKNTIKIFTDGACLNNGNADAKASIGVYFPDREYENVSERLEGRQTNNTAELEAIAKALDIVKDDDRSVIVHSDSEYCIKGITGVNKRKKNIELLTRIDNLMRHRRMNGRQTSFQWVKGHTGLQDQNYFADKLTNDAFKMSDEKQKNDKETESTTNLKRKREKDAGNERKEKNKVQKLSNSDADDDNITSIEEERELIILYRQLAAVDRMRVRKILKCFINIKK